MRPSVRYGDLIVEDAVTENLETLFLLPLRHAVLRPAGGVFSRGGYLTPPAKSPLTKIRDNKSMEADGPLDFFQSIFPLDVQCLGLDTTRLCPG
jgi:hypothetical protein